MANAPDSKSGVIRTEKTQICSLLNAFDMQKFLCILAIMWLLIPQTLAQQIEPDSCTPPNSIGEKYYDIITPPEPVTVIIDSTGNLIATYEDAVHIVTAEHQWAPPPLSILVAQDEPPPFTVLGIKFKGQKNARQWADGVATIAVTAAGYCAGRAEGSRVQHGHSSDWDRFNRLQFTAITFDAIGFGSAGAATVLDNEPGRWWRFAARIICLSSARYLTAQWAYNKDVYR